MKDTDKVAEDLFEKIRDRFEEVSLGDSEAKSTQSPREARFFNFDYVDQGKNFGNITISIIDSENLKIYFSRNITSKLSEVETKRWYHFLREMREFARRNLLSFEPRDITRGTLKHRDLDTASKNDSPYTIDEIELGESADRRPAARNFERFLRHQGIGYTRTDQLGYTKFTLKGTNAAVVVDGVGYTVKDSSGNELLYTTSYSELMTVVNKLSELDSSFASLQEQAVVESNMYGTRRRSYEDRGQTRIVVRHRREVDPDRPGARSRQIESIFVENCEGERFKMQHNSLPYARAMARHINEGGTVHDEFAGYLTNCAEEMQKLRRFTNKTRRRTFEDEDTTAMINSSQQYARKLRETLKRAAGANGYKQVMSKFLEETADIEPTDTDQLKQKFTQHHIDPAVEEALPIVDKAHKIMKNRYLEEFDAWAEKVTEGTWSMADNEQDIESLYDLLSGELVVGVDAMNATAALYDYVGDDEMFATLEKIAEDDPEADVSSVVVEWIHDNAPDLYEKLNSVHHARKAGDSEDNKEMAETTEEWPEEVRDEDVPNNDSEEMYHDMDDPDTDEPQRMREEVDGVDAVLRVGDRVRSGDIEGTISKIEPGTPIDRTEYLYVKDGTGSEHKLAATEVTSGLDEGVGDTLKKIAAAGIMLGGVSMGMAAWESKVPVVQAMETAAQEAENSGNTAEYEQISQDIKKVKDRLRAGRGLDFVEAMQDRYLDETQLDEISQDTKKRYIDKAVDDHGHSEYGERVTRNKAGKEAEHEHWQQRAKKRKEGISRANKTLDESFEKGAITISDGVVHHNGKQIGTLEKDFKHGYHPVALLKLNNGYEETVELDTPDLMDVIVDKITAAIDHDTQSLDESVFTLLKLAGINRG